MSDLEMLLTIAEKESDYTSEQIAEIYEAHAAKAAAELEAMRKVIVAARQVIVNCSGRGDGYMNVKDIYTDKLVEELNELKGLQK